MERDRSQRAYRLRIQYLAATSLWTLLVVLGRLLPDPLLATLLLLTALLLL